MSHAELRHNLDKLHRWTFGQEGEWSKDVAREFVDQIGDLLAALESQPEQTANVEHNPYVGEGEGKEHSYRLSEDRDALIEVIAEYTFPASSIADAILAAGFSRAQGDVTVEWQVRSRGDGRRWWNVLNEAEADDLLRRAPETYARKASRTVTPWKEVAADE